MWDFIVIILASIVMGFFSFICITLIIKKFLNDEKESSNGREKRAIDRVDR
jgi:hypothetical protein